MKKLTKIMLTLAAASAMTVAMAVTAMAEDTITGTYDNTTGQVTMNGVIGSGKSQTILVLDNNEPAGIAYINQIDNNGTFSTFMLEAGLQSTTPVTYNIKIGGTDKSLQTGTLTIAAGTPATVTIKYGDVNGDNSVNIQDITNIGKFIGNRNKPNQSVSLNTGFTRSDGTEDGVFKYGDVNGDSSVNIQDITNIGKFIGNRNKPNQSVSLNTGFTVDLPYDAQFDAESE